MASRPTARAPVTNPTSPCTFFSPVGVPSDANSLYVDAWNSFYATHAGLESAGVIAPAAEWFLAERATGS